jgi:hypothetical protein
LKPNNPTKLQDAFHLLNDEVEFGSGGKQMAKHVQVGDNVAVKCQISTDKDYWILLCDKELHMIE